MGNIKTYCKYCEYYIKPYGDIPYCDASQNKGTWLSEEDIREHPSIINQNNDCKWFVQRL